MPILRGIRALWKRVHEPRVVSFLYFAQYVVLTLVGVYALAAPPTSIAGQIGSSAMAALATLLVLGGVIGSIAVLPGKYWLERFAVISVGVAAGIYLLIVLGLHVTSPGNRLLQAGFIVYVLLHQPVRWVRISARPFRPAPPIVEA